MKTTTIYLVGSLLDDEMQWAPTKGEAIKLARTLYAAPTGEPGWIDAYEIPGGASRRLACLLLSGSGFALAIRPLILPGQGIEPEPEVDDEGMPIVLSPTE